MYPLPASLAAALISHGGEGVLFVHPFPYYLFVVNIEINSFVLQKHHNHFMYETYVHLY